MTSKSKLNYLFSRIEDGMAVGYSIKGDTITRLSIKQGGIVSREVLRLTGQEINTLTAILPDLTCLIYNEQDFFETYAYNLFHGHAVGRL